MNINGTKVAIRRHVFFSTVISCFKSQTINPPNSQLRFKLTMKITICCTKKKERRQKKLYLTLQWLRMTTPEFL